MYLIGAMDFYFINVKCRVVFYEKNEHPGFYMQNMLMYSNTSDGSKVILECDTDEDKRKILDFFGMGINGFRGSLGRLEYFLEQHIGSKIDNANVEVHVKQSKESIKNIINLGSL